MIIYSLPGNNVLTLNGNFLTQKVRTLTFQYQGDRFPQNALYPSGTNDVSFQTTGTNTVKVSYGDGVVDTFTWSGTLSFSDDPAPLNLHQFQDGNTGSRFISFEFEDLASITSIRFYNVLLWGQLPVETGAAENLNSIVLTRTFHLTSFPESLSENTLVTDISLDQISPNMLEAIPDSFFNMSIEKAVFRSTFDLSDIISSNFFKINQWKDGLYFLDIRECNVLSLPDEIAECQSLVRLQIDSNPISYIPEILGSLPNLTHLEIGDLQPFTDTSWIDFTQNTKIHTLYIRVPNMDFQSIPQAWAPLVSLNSFPGFSNFVTDDTRFDEFINVFYTLITNNAYIDPSSSTAQADDYPNKFREISWGDPDLTFSGTYQAPAGYSQGISNGTSANEGEKVYVLINQYGHTVTSAN